MRKRVKESENISRVRHFLLGNEMKKCEIIRLSLKIFIFFFERKRKKNLSAWEKEIYTFEE
jgi:hypothetical protein